MTITTSVSLSSIGSSALFFFITALSGILLSHLGKPFNTLVFTVHKLSALATVFVIARQIYQLQKLVDVTALTDLGVIPATAILFIVLVVTGALLGLPKPLSLPMDLVHTVHRLTPLLALVATVAAFYLLSSSRS